MISVAKEIERKFLVKKGMWHPSSKGLRIRQGYLSTVKERVVRVRTKGEKAFLTIKGENQGIVRQEFEYGIPAEDAEKLLELCEQPIIEKVRYLEIFAGKHWEIDCFFGVNEGLLLAELELDSSEEQFSLPVWVGQEVSGEEQYYNSNLIRHPYKTWIME